MLLTSYRSVAFDLLFSAVAQYYVALLCSLLMVVRLDSCLLLRSSTYREVATNNKQTYCTNKQKLHAAILLGPPVLLLAARSAYNS